MSQQAGVSAVWPQHPSFVGFSAPWTTTMTMMKTMIEALKAAGPRDPVKVMVGRAHGTRAYAAVIGADIYAAEAGSGGDPRQASPAVIRKSCLCPIA